MCSGAMDPDSSRYSCMCHLETEDDREPPEPDMCLLHGVEMDGEWCPACEQYDREKYGY